MTKNPTTLELYRSYDPVIQQHVPPRDAGRYAAARDPEILFEAGLPREATPVVFVCKALSRTQREILETIGMDRSRWRAAFRMGLVEIRNLADDAGVLRSPSTWRPTRGAAHEPLDDAALDAIEGLGFGDADYWEIGAAVEELSTVGKGVAPSCPLPDSSRRAWNSRSSSRPAERATEGEAPTEP